MASGGAACDKKAQSAAHQSRNKTPVRVFEARVETVTEYRRLSGDVKPWELLPLSFKVGGRIAALKVDEGDKVKKNGLVAVLDAQDYWLTRNLARAQVKALEPHLKRAKALHAQNALAKAELQKLQGKMRAAKVQYQQAQAQLSYVRLRSPLSGVVVKRMVAVGDMVGPSRPVAAVAKLKKVKVVLPVSQVDLHHFKKGKSLTLEAAGLKGEFTGVIHQVGYSADSQTRTFPVTVKVDNPALALRAGMIVKARIAIAAHKGIFVPLSAVRRDIRGDSVVLVVEGSATGKKPHASARKVKLETRVGERVQVTAGLSPGELVIVRGMVSDGDLVRVCKGECEKQGKTKP